MSFKDLTDMSIMGNPEKEGDYIEDGILHCGKCHTPKRAYVTINNTTYEVGKPCKCKNEQIQEEKEKERKCKIQKRISELRNAGIRDELFHSYTFSNDNKHDKKISAICINYAEKFSEMQAENIGMLLYGDVGTGKTFYAVAIANALIDKGVSCLVTNFPTILNKIQQTFEKDNFINSLMKCELLVIDDLGVERNTEYAHEQIYNVIDARYRSNKPIIITTNLPLEKLKSACDIADDRIYDRIISMCSITLKVTGISQRRENAIQSKKKAKEILSKREGE